MPADPAATWELLADVESVAACMPGAKVTERIDDRHFKGTVTVKLGPAALSFRGDMEVRELDAENRTLLLGAKGTDTSGSSAASLDLKAVVREAADGTSALTGTCEATINGRAATFGGRMMDTVAEQILGQFAVNFAARLQARAPAPRKEDPVGTPAASSGPPPAAPLNAMTLLWAAVRSWLRGLFKKRIA
jgi:carbon monoxide dehydrogenase subunit G